MILINGKVFNRPFFYRWATIVIGTLLNSARNPIFGKKSDFFESQILFITDLGEAVFCVRI